MKNIKSIVNDVKNYRESDSRCEVTYQAGKVAGLGKGFLCVITGSIIGGIIGNMIKNHK